MITVDQLRAAGALDCPAWMRKSLGPEPKKGRNLFSDLPDDEEVLADESDALAEEAEEDEEEDDVDE